MNVRIVTISIETSVENQRGVHERARVHKTATLTNLHLFNIEDKASIENLESNCTFTSKYHNFIVSDLISKSHVSRNPFWFVHYWGRNFLPNISWNVIAFYSVDDLFLVYTTAERENIVVLKSTKTDTGSWNSHWVNLLPLIFLSIVLLTIAIDRVIDVSANNIDKTI